MKGISRQRLQSVSSNCSSLLGGVGIILDTNNCGMYYLFDHVKSAFVGFPEFSYQLPIFFLSRPDPWFSILQIGEAIQSSGYQSIISLQPTALNQPESHRVTHLRPFASTYIKRSDRQVSHSWSHGRRTGCTLFDFGVASSHTFPAISAKSKFTQVFLAQSRTN